MTAGARTCEPIQAGRVGVQRWGPGPAYSIASSTRSLSVTGSGQRSSAAARRSRVAATVLRAIPSDRAIARSVAPHSCLRRRISRTRRIDTLSAGIGPPARRCRDEQSAEHYPAVERLPPLSGVADFKSESLADFIPESVADFPRNLEPSVT